MHIRKNIILGMVIMFIIMGVTIAVIKLIPSKDENNKNEQIGLILVAKGSVNQLYINTTNNGKINDKSTITGFLIEPSINIDNKLVQNGIKLFIGNNFIVKPTKSGGEKYIQNNSNKELSVHADGSISYYDPNYNTNNLMQQKELLSMNDINNKSMKIIKQLNINITQLKIEKFINQGYSSTNSSKASPLGYSEQWIIYRQYINNIPIKGSRGDIHLRFGKNGTLFFFLDQSIRVNKILYTEKNIFSKNDCINYVANISLSNDVKYIVNKCDLVIYIQDLKLKEVKYYNLYYECYFNNINGTNPLRELFKASDFETV